MRKNIFVKVLSAFILLFYILTQVILGSDHAVSKYVMNRIETIANEPSRFIIDGMKRKTREERIEDNIKWYKEKGRINSHYNVYGLDIKDFRNQDDFMDENDTKRYDVHHKDIKPLRFVYQARNKLVCDNIIRRTRADVLPYVYFGLSRDKVIYPKEQNVSALEAFAALKDGKYMVKPIAGACGNGIYVLEKKDKKPRVTGNYGEIGFDRFIGNVKNDCLVQEYIEQHRDLAKLNKFALSTVRIVTTRFKDRAEVLSAILRVGTKSDAIVDNAHKGGTCIGIDYETGKLRGYGCYLGNKKVEKKHPVSHIKYDGYQLPYWNEVVKLVTELHESFPGLSSIGWDVGITENGPVVIEINDAWHVVVMQMTNGGFKTRWNYLKGI